MTVIKTAAPIAPGPRPVRRALVAGVALVASFALGTALFGWRQGWFLPRVEQFVLALSDTRDGPPRLSGVVPSALIQGEFHDIVAQKGGGPGLEVARGDVHADWGAAVASVMRVALDLNVFDLSVEHHEIHLDGESDTPSHRAEIEAKLAALTLPDDFTLSTEIGLPPGRLFAETVAPILEREATCGPLQLVNMPEEGLAEGAPLRIAGRIETDGDRIALNDALRSVAGDRPLEMDLTGLNRSLCLFYRSLPALPESGIDIAYSFGRTGQPNGSDRFFPGENPVVDLDLPPRVVEGHLYLAYIGADGSVARLLPNASQPDNTVASLRAGAEGEVAVRVTHSGRVARGTDKLTIWIDGRSPGIGAMVLLHTDAAVLPAPLRTTETVESFAGAVKTAVQTGRVLAAKTRYLITETN